jgi:hypothetical protein
VKRLVIVGIVAAGLAAVLLTARLHDLSGTPVRGVPYVPRFDHPHSPWNKLFAIGDGQAYAQLATDPALARPEAFGGGAAAAAYRAGRPLYPELVWAVSLGQPGNVPYAMAVLCVGGVGVAAMALGNLARRRGVTPWVGVVAAVVPGLVAATSGLTPEALAMAAVLLAVSLWERARRPTPAIVTLLVVSVLVRETMLVVPAVFVVDELRRRGSPHRFRDAAVLLGAPVLALGASYLVVRARFGAWPFAGSPSHTFTLLPGAGFLRAALHWGPSDWFVFLLAIAVPLVYVRRAGPGPNRMIVAGYAAVAPFLGYAVWHHWDDFARVLVPLTIFTIAALMDRGGSEPIAPADVPLEPQVMSSMR